MKKQTLFLMLAGAMFIVSCKKKEGCTDPTATNYDAEAETDNGTCNYPEEGYAIPTTYAFTDASGNSTVSYTGQLQRKEMLAEMTDYMKTANTSGTAVDAQTLKNMFANSGYTWMDAPGLDMNNTTKQLKDKCVGGDVGITNQFEAWMDSIAMVSSMTTVGMDNGGPGVAGVVVSNDGTKKYLCNTDGIEYTQLIEKGLMGAVFLYQITEVYLGDGKMNVDNSTAVDPSAGKYYTEMEHHWDEAFGYFTDSVNFPLSGTDRHWAKYAWGREPLINSASNIIDAFLAGRAAISNNDMTERDAQRAILRYEMQRLSAATAIHYINSGLSNITDDALLNHALSEAWAFIYSLQFANNPIMGTTEVNTALGLLGTDLYNVNTTDLNAAKDQISAAFGLDSVKDIL